MEELSQTKPAPRSPRPWTDEEQKQAEKMWAQGMSYRVIGQELSRSHVVVRAHLDPLSAEKQRERQRLWRQKNPDKAREKAQRYRDANKEKILERHRQYQRANRQKINDINRKYYAAHSKEVIKRNRLYQQANPDRERERKRRRRSFVRASRRLALAPLSIRQIRDRLALFGESCAYCGAQGGLLTIDHVLPLIAGGLDEASNVVPACSRCNSSKNAADVQGWYQKQPFFTEKRWLKIQRHCPNAVAGQLPLALSA